MENRILILDNLRSAHNVGTILRTADGAGWPVIYLCGSTPAPHLPGDPRPPYAQDRAAKEIAKTALGAEQELDLYYAVDTVSVITRLRQDGCLIIGLEQSPKSISLDDVPTTEKMAVIVGNEVQGVSEEVLKLCDVILELPMRGRKESLNVAVAAGIAMYRL
jgi:23S rRNA (guanosine2251-2'-O)-methyltransferase